MAYLEPRCTIFWYRVDVCCFDDHLLDDRPGYLAATSDLLRSPVIESKFGRMASVGAKTGRSRLDEKTRIGILFSVDSWDLLFFP